MPSRRPPQPLVRTTVRQLYRDGGTNPVRDGGDAPALVEVGAAKEDQDPLLTDPVRADRPAVPLHRGRRETGQLGHRELGLRSAERIARGRPAGTHHERDVVGLGTGQLAQAGGGVGGGRVRVALDVVRNN